MKLTNTNAFSQKAFCLCPHWSWVVESEATASMAFNKEVIFKLETVGPFDGRTVGLSITDIHEGGTVYCPLPIYVKCVKCKL